MKKSSITFRCLSLSSLLLSFAGCTQPAPPQVATNTAATDQAESIAKPAEVEIQLEIKSWEEMQQWVASQKGKVVVLDLWSNW